MGGSKKNDSKEGGPIDGGLRKKAEMKGLGKGGLNERSRTKFK